ncbi:MAG: universal stress protein [Gammaproteobacteria bacterium]
MAFKKILIHADSSAACDHRVRLAMRLAKQQLAELASVYIVPDYFLPTYYEAQISPEIIERSDRLAREKAQKAQNHYQREATEAGMSMNVHIEQGSLISKLCTYARYADLLVLGQSNPDDPDNMSEALADNLVLEGGVPCLVVPEAEPVESIGERVLVAWNASRESARALRDSLPILMQAERVVLLSAGSESDDEREDRISISNYLALNGINAELRVESGNGAPPGETIVSSASAMNADLIVMGAYGHSRLRELVLGGATRHLLHNMPVPIFISH